MIKGIILDYGGTIDTNGMHWAEVLWQQYLNAGVPVDRATFREAYKHGERTLALQPIIRPDDNFHDVLLAKIRIQLKYLVEAGHLPPTFDVIGALMYLTRNCYAQVRKTVAEAVPTLEVLSQTCPLVLVSNFYGNIHAVLDDLGISSYFKDIIESAVVGVRKPDPAIFALGVSALGCDASHVAVVGDSYTKDIVPAKETGCYTIWLKGEEWEETLDASKADAIIDRFDELRSLVCSAASANAAQLT